MFGDSEAREGRRAPTWTRVHPTRGAPAHGNATPPGVPPPPSGAAERLITDDSGAVVGLQVRNPNGGLTRMAAGAVILAAGGFQGNGEMMSRYFGESAYRIPPISRGGRNNRGDGL